MRAGPLSDPGIQARLRAGFVNCWALAKDLPALARSAGTAAARELAAAAERAYQYPVDSQVWSAAGRLLGQAAANDLFEDPLGGYARLLDAAAPAPK